MNHNMNISGKWAADWDTSLVGKPLFTNPVMGNYVNHIACSSYVTGYLDGYSKAQKQFVLPHYYQTYKNSAGCSGDFDKFKEEWQNDTAIISNPNQIAMHPAYQRIIGMGANAVPLIIREMVKKPGHWFWALKAITGEDPVPEETRGSIKRMTDLWLDWWEENKKSYE